MITTEQRARLSEGSSLPTIYAGVATALGAVHPGGGTLVDVGCGGGALWPVLRSVFARYVGVDIIRYVGFPADGVFVTANLDDRPLPLAMNVRTWSPQSRPSSTWRTLAHSCGNSHVWPNRGAS